ncbi:hypothetical protein YC2023_114535 [Brassica napus]
MDDLSGSDSRYRVNEIKARRKMNSFFGYKMKLKNMTSHLLDHTCLRYWNYFELGTFGSLESAYH